MASTDEAPPAVNPAPAGHETAVFVVREAVALLFALVWLALLVWDILEGAEARVPFWVHCVGVGTLSYALGLSVASLTSFRKPTVRGAVRAVRGAE